MESGPSSHSRATSRRRVASPSAAKTGAASTRLASLPVRDIPLNALQLRGPPAVVHPERFGATRCRETIEPRLHDREDRFAAHLVQLELDERRRLRRVVHAGVEDRKSTRLNSSHEWISYAVFC